jgi:cytidyltransferase-like protein
MISQSYSNIFLTKEDNENLSKWKYTVEDKSISTKIFGPFWNWLAEFIPDNVAPNILSLAGLICILYSFNLSYNYFEEYPIFTSLMTFLLVFIYMNLDAIDGKHARKINNSSPLGEFFDHSCDNIGVVFMVLPLCYTLGISNHYIQWYAVQIAQLAFLHSHIRAFKERIVKFGKFTGPGEFIMIYMIILLGRCFTDYSLLKDIMISISGIFGMNPEEFGNNVIITIYYLVYIYVIYTVLSLHSYATRNGLLISLFARFIPSILIYFNLLNDRMTTYTVISHGLIMAIITGDIIIAKMASRDLQPLIPIFIMVSLFDNFLCIILCGYYYKTILNEISTYMNLPIFSVKHNVFCSGVFDLLHEGHIRMFQNASKCGTNLIVGVHDDKVVESYKRKPIMTHSERCFSVVNCKYVNEIVEKCPLYVTEEIIKKYNVHIVVCSPEYDKPDDLFYKVPRDMGILKVLPRTDTISTSDLIKRMKH